MIEFPEVFVTGKIPENRTDRELCADALCAWGIVLGKLITPDELPDNFGDGMVAISLRLGVSASPESIIHYAHINFPEANLKV